MDGRPDSILILVGGTAGWMAVCLSQHHWGRLGTRGALIESKVRLPGADILLVDLDEIDCFVPLVRERLRVACASAWNARGRGRRVVGWLRAAQSAVEQSHPE